MELLEIEDVAGDGLLFRFDDEGVERVWSFETATLTEFLALILKGHIHGQAVELPDAAIEVRGEPGAEAAVGIRLRNGVEFSLPTPRRRLQELGAAIERVLAQGGRPS